MTRLLFILSAALSAYACTILEEPYQSNNVHWHDRAVKRMYGSPLDDRPGAEDARAGGARGW